MLIAAVWLIGPAMLTAAARGSDPQRGALYTASDFKSLADGVDAGFSGEAKVSVWAPSGDRWHLTASDGTITLHVEAQAGDPTPGWQSLGKVSLAKGHPL